MDPAVTALGARLVSNDDAIVEAAAQDAAVLLEGPEVTEEARRYVRARLVETIDRDPTRPVSAVAVWVLGKLYDPSLEPYLASLAAIFVTTSDLPWHVRQTVVALDNLELVPAWREAPDPDDAAALRQILIEYLARPNSD